MKSRKFGFTLLELMMVIILIGILGTMGFTQYTKVIEKGRAAEAKKILGEIRSAQASYKLQHGDYGISIDNLYISAPTACTQTHYFSYEADTAKATAYRCTSDGKFPNASDSYQISLEYDNGAWGGDSGYY